MDGTILQIGLFLAATFVAAVVTGVAGFAFGLVASGVWLHVITPLQTATLIVGYGLVVQGYSVWKLRRNLDFSLLWPFLLGVALGVPVGVNILGLASPEHMRAGVGAVLIAYSVYSLLRPNLPPAKSANVLADGTAGFLNGVLGGMTGLSGILVIICADCAAGRAMFSVPCFNHRSVHISHERNVARCPRRHRARYAQAVRDRLRSCCSAHGSG
jgi:uncharacterized membrane protein YfcA